MNYGFIFTVFEQGKFYYSHFTDEEFNHKETLTCPKSHKMSIVVLGSKPKIFLIQSSVLTTRLSFQMFFPMEGLVMAEKKVYSLTKLVYGKNRKISLSKLALSFFLLKHFRMFCKLKLRPFWFP